MSRDQRKYREQDRQRRRSERGGLGLALEPVVVIEKTSYGEVAEVYGVFDGQAAAVGWVSENAADGESRQVCVVRPPVVVGEERA